VAGIDMEEFSSKAKVEIGDLKEFKIEDPKEFLRGYLEYKEVEFADIFKV
jgi:hypothetical protein